MEVPSNKDLVNSNEVDLNNDLDLEDARNNVACAKQALLAIDHPSLEALRQDENSIIQFAWECVGILIGNENTAKVINDPTTLGKIIDLNTSHISQNTAEKIRAKLASYPKFKEDAFNSETVGSQAAEFLIHWIFAVVDYLEVEQRIKERFKKM